MPHEPLGAVLEFLRNAQASHELHELADGQLLERFLSHKEDGAFAVLVHRHGPMVMGVCRRVLGDVHNAEDAFQATFMVLVRRAGSVRRSKPLANWLHGVAQRVALKARAKSAARQTRERELIKMPRTEPIDELTWQELRTVLDEEIERLPAKCRSPIVLCHLEGMSYDQAAKELGWPKSSLASRLEKARELLRQRLVKRGIALSTGAMATVLSEKSAGAAVGGMLTVNTVKAAAGIAAGGVAVGNVLSAGATALMEEAMKEIVGLKVKLVAIVVALSLAVGGAGVAGFHGLGGTGSSDTATRQELRPQGADKNEQQQANAKDEQQRFDIHGDPLPAGAIARLGTLRWQHDHRRRARFAGFLPDGKHVVTVSDGIRIWDFPAGKEVRKIGLPPTNGTWGYGALSNDGKVIATQVNNSGEIHLWEVESGRKLPRLKLRLLPPPGILFAHHSLIFSPKGNQLACLAGDGTLRIWDWVTATEIYKCSTFGDPSPAADRFTSISMAYSPDGKIIALAQGKPMIVRVGQEPKRAVLKLINAFTGAEILTVKSEAAALSPTFSPDGKILAYASGEAVNLLETSTGKEMRKLSANRLSARALVFSKDGSKIFASSDHGGIMEWDIASGKQLRAGTAAAPADRIALSPDGKTLMLYGGVEHGPHFLDLTGVKEIKAVNYRTASLLSLHFTPDGTSLITTRREETGDLSLQKWDAATGSELGPVVLPHAFTSIALSPDGKLLAGRLRGPNDSVTLNLTFTGKLPAKVAILELATHKILGEIVLPASEANMTMNFSPDSSTLAIRQYEEGKTELFEVPTGRLLHLVTINRKAKTNVPHRKPVFSPDGKILATSDNLDAVGLWDTKTGAEVSSLPMHWCKDCEFTPDGRCLLLNGVNGIACLYELASGKLRRTFGQEQLPSPLICIAFSPDSRLLAQAGRDGVVRLLDIANGRELATFKSHTARVEDLVFSPDGKNIVSASIDGTALIWDVSKIEQPKTPAKSLQEGDLEKLWKMLAEDNAEKAWSAMCVLAAAPKEATTWIKDRIKPVKSLDAKRVEDLIRQLDDKQFKVREAATSELFMMGDQIVTALSKALTSKPSAETKQRLEDLSGKLTGLVLRGERLRAFRAVEVLELIGTPEARHVLQGQAAGARGALVTESAQAALKRLSKN